MQIFTVKELAEYLKSILEENDTVLFKGSRSMKMEEIFHKLYKEWDV
jgi:UDP-N-acetylmuramyl pentapeptide synthase